MRFVFCAVAVLAAGGCDYDYVTVDVIGAYVGPGKAPAAGEVEGDPWDGTADPVPAEVFDLLLDLSDSLDVVTPDDAGEVIAEYVNALIDSTSPPDPMGTVELSNGGDYSQPVEVKYTDGDVFFTDWEVAASFSDVDVMDDVRLRVDLMDKDLLENDSIGTAVVTKEQYPRGARRGDRR